MGRPSMEALAMAGADWALHGVDDDDENAPPPAHLRAFEAFLEKVVPADMALAFGREEAARAGEERRRRSHREDVEEKLKLWAKAVAREARRGVLAASAKSQQVASATSPRLIAHARDGPEVVVARPTGEPNPLARGRTKEKEGDQTLPGQARAAEAAGKVALSPKVLLAPSPRSGRRGGEHCQSNQPLPKQDIKCIYGV
ncbi:unnamed protein product [Urochloa humidicola]